MRDADVERREQGDLVLVHVDAMRGDDARPEDPGLGQRRDRRATERRDQVLGERLPGPDCR